VLDIARWFTIACGTAYARHFEAAYRQRASELGTDVVPFADWWVLETDAIFRERPPFLEPVVRELGAALDEAAGTATRRAAGPAPRGGPTGAGGSGVPGRPAALADGRASFAPT
jgi:hypothetical protein